MMTKEGARFRVSLELFHLCGRRTGPEELVILDEQTIERPWGWVFAYTSRGWLNGDWRYALGGNAPFIVNRYDGTLRVTGTGEPIEHYIARYEAELARQDGARLERLFGTEQEHQ